MTYKIYPEQDVEAIAEAIRNKNGLTNKYKIGEMADAINNLGIYSLSGEDNAPYLYRKTPLTSDVELDKIVGGSVVFNQLVRNVNKSSTTNNGVTFTVNDDGTITANGTAENGDGVFTYGVVDYIANHKYACLGVPDGSSATTYFCILLSNVYSNTIKTISNADYFTARILVKNGVTVNNVNFNPICIDLTQMFGSTIADYVYQLEQSSAGSGVSYLKSLGYFADDYYPYNSGEIKSVSGLSSHDMVGFNQWDEETKTGYYNGSNGEYASDTIQICSVNPIKVFPNAQYYIKTPSALRVCCYDENMNFISTTGGNVSNEIITTPNNCSYIHINTFASPPYPTGTTYNNDICINISDTNRDGEYEPYVKHSYPLDNTLTLRGIPKLSDGKLYYDGDVYNSDGSVVRKYGVVDLGSLNWFYQSAQTRFYTGDLQELIKPPKTGSEKPNCCCSSYKITSFNDFASSGDFAFGTTGNAFIMDSNYTDATAFKQAMQGVYLIYELAESTTESAEPYSTIQICDGAGTEEYVTTGIPVGHETKYLELVEI